MTTYLDTADTDDEADVTAEHKTFTETEISLGKETAATLKGEGNDAFVASKFQEAVDKYTQALNALKGAGLPKDPIILLNRSASYLGLQRYVPALNDANQAAELDPTNWKAHWRKGVSLMSMSKRLFRSKQAVAAFETCLTCGTLPENKIAECNNELKKARARMEQQDAEVRRLFCCCFRLPSTVHCEMEYDHLTRSLFSACSPTHLLSLPTHHCRHRRPTCPTVLLHEPETPIKRGRSHLDGPDDFMYVVPLLVSEREC